jgi:KAP family P-loop domain
VADITVKSESAAQARIAGPEEVDSRPAPPSLRMLADRPLDTEVEDRLDFTVYAQALAELIDHPGTHTPLTIAVSAPWGAGKTSLARLVARRLASWREEWGQPPHIECWFNAWAHDDAAHLGAAFAADVARTVDRERSWWRRLRSPLPAAMLSPRDRWRRRVLIGLATLALAVGLAFVPQVRKLFEDSPGADLDAAFGARVGTIAFFLAVILAVWKYVLAAAERAARFIDDPRSEAARGSMKEVSDELGRLIRDATRGRRRLVVFVDDLERCRPPRALEVCEAAGNLLAHPDVVTVLIADMRVVASSAELKYRQLESADEQGRTNGDYGRRYLQKIVQIQFDLPPATEERVRDMLLTEARARPALHGAFEPRPQRGWFVAWASRLPEPWRRVVATFVAVVLPLLGLVIPLATGVYFAIDPPAAADDRSSAFFTGAVGAAVVLFVAAAVLKAAYRVGRWLFRLAKSYRDARRLRRIDASITKYAKLAKDESDARTVAELVELEHRFAAGSSEARLVADRVARFFTHESPLKTEAEAEIVQFLPLIPRSAKRMMNHLRLRLYVSIRREMLGDGAQLTPRHLGKWVVLEERWPELVHGLVEKPGNLKKLEQTEDVTALASELEALGLDAEPSDDLFRFVRAEPRLGTVAEQLIFLEPDRA